MDHVHAPPPLSTSDRRNLLARGIDVDQLQTSLAVENGRQFVAVQADLGLLQTYVIVADSDGRHFHVDPTDITMVEIRNPAPRFSFSRRR